MSNMDTMVSLDQEDSAQLLDLVGDFSLDPQSPKLATAVFGSARKRSITKLKEPSRRDSQTLPWTSTSPPRSKTSSMDPNKRLPQPPRSASPDIDVILAKTPRPHRKKAVSVFSTSPRSQGKGATKSTSKLDDHAFPDHSLSSIYSSLLDDDLDAEGSGSESDSSIDIHTPLPHLMFRDGLLSPRSKLLPQSTPHSIYSSFGDKGAGSVLSLASTSGSVVTKSGLQRDPRDTERRRLRHRDGRLLKAGMGLTTGLGWSDSEDEDAPSALTRRLITTTTDRERSGSVSSRPSSLYGSVSASRLTSPTPALSRKPMSHSNLRSTSISFPTKAPVSPTSGPGTGLRVPRGRAASAAAAGPSRPNTFKATLPPVRSESPVENRTPVPATPRAPFAFAPFAEPESPSTSSVSLVSDVTGRNRAPSSASTTSVRTATSTGSSSSHPMPPLKSAPAKSVSSRLPSAPALRTRSESNASNSTDVTAESSVASNYSQNSSSTSVPSSSSSSVPRPLRLPNTHVVTGLKSPGRSFSQDITSTSTAKPTPSSGVPAFYARPRTVSSPHAPRSPKSPSYTARTTSNSLSSGVLPPGAPPTLRQRERERATPGGARPRPRTGTGMVYRTSSYSSFHESGSRMRQSGVVSPS